MTGLAAGSADGRRAAEPGRGGVGAARLPVPLVRGDVRHGLRVDAKAEWTLSRIIHGLRSARMDAGLSQGAAAANLPVRGRAISEWETEAIMPGLDHWILWADELELRLVVTERGVEWSRVVQRRSGETWVHFERRRACPSAPTLSPGL